MPKRLPVPAVDVSWIARIPFSPQDFKNRHLVVEHLGSCMGAPDPEVEPIFVQLLEEHEFPQYDTCTV